MALPKIHEKPTPKRVAAYLVDTMINRGLNSEIEAMETAFGVRMSIVQRGSVIRHYEQYVQRIKKVLNKA